MVSNRWQKKQSVIQHLTLALIWGVPLLLLQVNWLPWQRLSLILVTWATVLPMGIYLNRHMARTMIRVFKHESDAVTGVVQRSLTKNYIRFSRQLIANETHFKIRDEGLTLVLEPYPLNLPIDSHIQSVDATKIEIRGLNKENRATAERLSELINHTAELSFSKS
ncbi:MAG: hypothetical protein AAGD96_23190 [Chloroflexota bacterium]